MSGALVAIVFGASYAAVPLYKVFCQVTGFGGTTRKASAAKAATVKPVSGGKVLTVDFVSNVHDTLPWTFTPTQRKIKVVPGETALAFFTAKNNSDKAITGVATYNVDPARSGPYFHKIQCFCFEEQRLGPQEEIDMPVFFFIDPEFLDDPSLENTHNIILSYTFFKTDEDDKILQKKLPQSITPPSSLPSSSPSSSTINQSNIPTVVITPSNIDNSSILKANN